jgi:hypothetical protein
MALHSPVNATELHFPPHAISGKIFYWSVTRKRENGGTGYMLWAFIAAILAGLATGYFFRAPVLMALAFLTALGAGAGGAAAGWSGWTIAWFTVALTATVQFAYLAGAVLAHGQRRIRQRMAEAARERREIEEGAGAHGPSR